jgi:intracellular sulfur oxidation DsrE/DsrF family protein
LHISVVVQGEAAHSLLKDGAYRKSRGTSEGNPTRSLVESLIGRGVSLEVSGLDMKEHGWSKDDLLDGVAIVAAAHQRIIDLQKRGYAYLAF